MQGKIIKGIAGFYYVDVAESGVYECKAKGIFRKERKKPLVGDNVEIEVLDEKEKTGNLIQILPRKNELIRPAAANVDQALVIFAVRQPDPNILGCSLNYAAYFAEIYRSGIESIPNGQYEAAQLLGYTRVQTFFKIVLPQVVKIVLPSVTNEVITLVKDTSLVYSVSYIEMFAVAKQIAAAQTTVVPFFIAGIFYYVFNYVVAWVMELFEKKLNYYR